jgi:antitoxin component YwqK of YwqJK toxin-antitoxin module
MIIAYKAAKHEDIGVIITLEIPADAVTNMDRKDIVDPQKALYETDKAKVLKIEDVSGGEYVTAIHGQFPDEMQYFNLGEYTCAKPISEREHPGCTWIYNIKYVIDKSIAEFEARENQLDTGIVYIYHPNGRLRSKTPFVNGKENGLYQSWYKNGTQFEEVMMVDNMFEGTYSIFDDKTGLVYETDEYVHNNRHGVRRMIYDTHIILEEHYVAGEKHGLCTEWHSNQQKSEECMWNHGKKVGLFQRWHENGVKAEELLYEDGIPVGTRTFWHENGVKSSERHFAQGKYNGLYQTWRMNGQLKMVAHYKDDYYDGLYQMWNRDGKLVRKWIYKEGHTLYRAVREEYSDSDDCC